MSASPLDSANRLNRHERLGIHPSVSSRESGYLKAIDIALFGLLCLAPFFLGGRYAAGRFVYVALVAVVAISWSLHLCFDRPNRLRRSAGEWIAGLAILVVGIQLIPLPVGLLAQLSPSLSQHLPLWSPQKTTSERAEGNGATDIGAPASGQTSDRSGHTPRDAAHPIDSDGYIAGLGTWNCISLAPTETLGGLAMLLAYAMLFVVVRGRLQTLRDIHRVLGLIALSAVLLAVVGLVQLASGTENHLGIYDHPFRTGGGCATASFYNSNHFAHMLALGVGPLVAWLTIATMRRRRQGRTNALEHGGRIVGRFRTDWLANPTTALVCLGIVLFAGLSALSRGGAIAISLAMAVAIVLLAWRRALPRTAVAALSIAAVLVGVAMAVYGFDQIKGEIDTIASGSVEQLDRGGHRREVWAANATAIGDFWRVGAGIGAHRFVLPAYLARSYSIEFTHAESGYLQIALEAGIVGVCLCAGAIGLCIYWCVKAWRGGGRPGSDPNYTIAVAAVAAGLAASIVHSIWDFVWYIPASMVTTIVLAACACQLKELTRSSPSAEKSPIGVPPLAAPRSPLFAWGAAAVTIVASLWMLGNRAGPALASNAWDSYLRASGAEHDATRREARDPSAAPASYEEQVMRVESMLGHLQRVLARDPQNGRVHLRFASNCLERFELAQKEAPNQMPISQIRAAAGASQFPSRRALDEWLSRAIGESRKYLDSALEHTRRGLQLCPMQAEGYLALADISFLDTPGDVAAGYLDQARRIHPNGGEVLIRTGAEAFASYDFDRAIEQWRQAYDSGPEYRTKLISICAGRIPVGMFLQWFEPDLETLRILDWRYEQLDDAPKLEFLRRYRVSQVIDAAREAEGKVAGKLWYEAFLLNRTLESQEDAIECGRNAARLAEYDTNVRLAVGRYFLTQRLYTESEQHLEWCVARDPTQKQIVRQLAAAKRGRLRDSAERHGQEEAGRIRR